MTNELLPSIVMVTLEGQRAKKPGWIAAIIGVIAITLVAAATWPASEWRRRSARSGPPDRPMHCER